MAGRIRSIAGHERESLVEGWSVARSPASDRTQSDGVPPAGLQWLPASRLGTVAAILRDTGAWSFDGPAQRFDAEDWWYRTRFKAPVQPSGAARRILQFGGLATLADAWLNGRHVLRSDNMFLGHELGMDGLLEAENELVLRFRSIDAHLKARRPRPRWRAPMIENQQLRWVRTTLLGRTPGWSVPAAPVGPWQPIWIEQRRNVDVGALQLSSRVEDGAGIVAVRCSIAPIGGTLVRSATLRIERNERQFTVPLDAVLNESGYHATLRVEQPDLWWPHTHGDPALYTACLQVETEAPDTGRTSVHVDLGKIGFRQISVDTGGNGFRISVNGISVFCRGACWTPLDPVSLTSPPSAYQEAVAQVRSAGMNMLRIGGTMVYEDDALLDACDELGIMLWHDFMFANMDYPEDSAFTASAMLEAQQLLRRLGGRPSLTVLCGNSEVEQQAAMWGAPRELWSPQLFHELLPGVVREFCDNVPYWPSSAHGGAFPHQNSAGTTSYYGVGAYLRPAGDARYSELRFATECLAFANVPEDSCLQKMPGGLTLKVHHPAWKARSPRDLGAGWDFDDVRDYYLKQFIGRDPLELRYADHERYLQLSRIVTGELMYAAYAEWRRRRSTCGGALVWFLRDLWPGAGWGVVDSFGTPKAALHYLRRALQPRAVFISDEGCNGLTLHITNDSAADLDTTLTLALYKGERLIGGKSTVLVKVPSHQTLELSAATMFEGFLDLSHAYRFGPPAFDVAVATLHSETGEVTSEAFHLLTGNLDAIGRDPELSADATRRSDGCYLLKIRSRFFARSIAVDAPGFDCEDQYFHLAPGGERELWLHPVKPAEAFRGSVRSINCAAAVQIKLTS